MIKFLIALQLLLASSFLYSAPRHKAAPHGPNSSRMTKSFLPAAPQESPWELLHSLGFATIDQEVSDFSLPNVSTGEMQKLSDHKGKWIWVAFWATWCGPCTYELPTLESLQQEFKNKNFQILGVNVDQTGTGPVKKFLTQKNISFLNLHDENSQVSAQYGANALPTLYVISPDWRLVGVFRGANNWETQNTLDLLKRLLPIKSMPVTNPGQNSSSAAAPNAGNSNTASGNSNQASPTAPSVHIDPPKLALVLSPQKNIRGEVVTSPLKSEKPFSVTVSITWQGSSQDYLIKVPTLTLPREVIEVGVSSEANSDQGVSQLHYHFQLMAHKEGKFKIGPAELSYQPRVGGNALFARIPGIEVDIVDPGFFPPNFFIFLFTLMAAFGGFGLLAHLKRKAQKNSFFPESKEASALYWEERLEKVRGMKLQSAHKDYVEELLHLYLLSKEMQQIPELEIERSRIHSLVQQYKYAGRVIATSTLESYERDIARFAKKLAIKNSELGVGMDPVAPTSTDQPSK